MWSNLIRGAGDFVQQKLEEVRTTHLPEEEDEDDEEEDDLAEDGENGWGEEDVPALEDEVEDLVAESLARDGHPEQSHLLHHHHPNNNSQPNAGGGLLIGRLSRFLEQVTQPDHPPLHPEKDHPDEEVEEEEDDEQMMEDGWGTDDVNVTIDDEDDNDNDDNEEEDNNNIHGDDGADGINDPDHAAGELPSPLDVPLETLADPLTKDGWDLEEEDAQTVLDNDTMLVENDNDDAPPLLEPTPTGPSTLQDVMQEIDRQEQQAQQSLQSVLEEIEWQESQSSRPTRSLAIPPLEEDDALLPLAPPTTTTTPHYHPLPPPPEPDRLVPPPRPTPEVPVASSPWPPLYPTADSHPAATTMTVEDDDDDHHHQDQLPVPLDHNNNNNEDVDDVDEEDQRAAEEDYLEDERRHDEAVLAIQQELGLVVAPPPPPPPPPRMETTAPVVDHTPREFMSSHPNTSREDPWYHPLSSAVTVDASVQAVATLEEDERDTGVNEAEDVEEEEDVYDLENELNYGPVVDHTPAQVTTSSVSSSLGAAHPLKRHDSLAVQALEVNEDIRQDDDLLADDDIDEEDALLGTISVGGAGEGLAADEEDGWDQTDALPDDDDLDLEGGGGGGGHHQHPPPVLVDHTPAMDEIGVARRVTDPSLGVLASLDDGDTIEDMMTVYQPDGQGPGQHGAHDPSVMDDPRHEFGPVVDHTPPTPAPGSLPLSSTVSLAVGADALEEDFQQDDAMDETCYGDSTCDAGTLAEEVRRLDAALAGSEVDDGWEEETDVLVDDDVDGAVQTDAQDEPPVVNKGKKTATWSSQFETRYVDLTPMGMPHTTNRASSSRSVDVLAAEDDLTRDTGQGDIDDEAVYDDENEIQFGLVVDQTPWTPGLASAMSAANSVAAHASVLDDDFQQDDAMDETIFGDSTIGGGTMDEATGAGWEQDDPVIEDDDDDDDDDDATYRGRLRGRDEVAMVDCTPSEVGTPRRTRGVSIDVQASEADTKEAGVDSTDGHVDFGPVVDHTPPTPAPRLIPSTDSVVVLVPDGDTVDGTLVGGSTIADADGEETVDDDVIPGQQRPGEDQLVDHIPFRSESRFGDASTLVAADPSEVMSEVDDMAPEEAMFGPVVDVTPPARPGLTNAELPSGACSTVVFAPASVAADDLDGDETEVAGGWDHDDPDIEEAPNPQSGNDEPLPRLVEETVVDFVPPPNEVEEVGREMMSEMTVGGALSLLQAEDPKEDDFGPVVDQTPTPRSGRLGISQSSTATQVTASECRALEKDDGAEEESIGTEAARNKVVVDHLPSMRDKLPIDSTATIARSQLSEEEEEEEDFSKFGPVVDHLPTPRASLAPSRGGSTVDALATVSEVDSDADGDGEGWDEDVDFDASEGGVSDGTSLITATGTRLSFRRSVSIASEHERNVSVRFDSSVVDSPSVHRGHGLIPSTDNGIPAEQTQYFDAEAGEGWDDDLGIDDNEKENILSKEPIQQNSFSEADTPPSTPYRRPNPEALEQVDEELDNGIMYPQPELTSCQACDKSTGIDCPCIRRLLEANFGGNGDLIGRVRTGDGRSVQINLSTMLQDEIARRRLVEEESRALRSSLESLKSRENAALTKQKELESEVSRLTELNVGLTETTSQIEAEKAIAENKDTIIARLTEDLETKRLEVERLLLAFNTSNSNATENLERESLLASVQLELNAKSGECQDLHFIISQLKQQLQESEARCSDQSREVEELSSILEREVTSFNKKLLDAQHNTEKAEIATKQAKLESTQSLAQMEGELTKLRAKNDLLLREIESSKKTNDEKIREQSEQLESQARHFRNLEQKLLTIESEKAGLVISLTEANSIQSNFEFLKVERDSLLKANELLQKSLDESKGAVASLQRIIDEHGMEKEALDSKRDLENNALRNQIRELSAVLVAKDGELRKLRESIGSAEREGESHKMQIQNLEARCSSLGAQIQATQASSEEERSRNQELQSELLTLRRTLEAACAERDKATEDRRQSIAHLAELGKSLKRFELERGQREREISILQESLKKNQDELAVAKEEKQTNIVEFAKLQDRLKDLEKKSAASQSDFDNRSRHLSQEYERETFALRSECEKLRKELGQQTRQVHDLELRLHAAESAERDTKLKFQELQAAYSTSKDAFIIREREATEAENELYTLRSECDQLRRELGESQRQRKDLEDGRKRLSELEIERVKLAEENEDMLVQFGLVKHQMDVAHERIMLLEGALSASQSETSPTHKSQDQIESLQRQNESLNSHVAVLSERNHALEASIAGLTTERDEFSSQVVYLRSQLATLMNANGAKASQVENLRLEEICRRQGAELVELRENDKRRQLDQAEYLRRHEILQMNLSEKERECMAKDSELQRLREGLEHIHSAHGTAVEENEKLRRSEARANELGQFVDQLTAELDDQKRKIEQIKTEHSDELGSVRNELLIARSAVADRDRVVDELRLRIKEIDARYKASRPPPLDLTLEAQGNPDDLRSRVASLALELERSEARRADANGRLLTERQVNADSLRRLSESVKRFYTSLSATEV